MIFDLAISLLFFMSMKNRLNITFVCFFLGIVSCWAQNSNPQPYCGFGKMKTKLGLNSYPSYKSINGTKDIGQYFIIPVVVHVIYDSAKNNISDAIVQSQITVLNEDYGHYGRGYNPSPLGTEAKIIFSLAALDPKGNPTIGIEHIQSSSYANISSDSEMRTKDLSVWDTKRYLNIWVVKSIDQNAGAGTETGYAYLASDVPNLTDPNADGIVVNYRFFGRNTPYNIASYNYGRTTTHETGHYFNLLHTWGLDGAGMDGCTDGNDDVDDTPPCSGAYYSKYHGKITDSCDDPIQCGNYLRLVADYMDYSQDRCMDIFTRGQINRMRQAILSYRPGLVSYENAVSAGLKNLYLQYNQPVADALDIVPNPGNGTFYIYPDFLELENADLYIYDQLGRLVSRNTMQLKNEKTAVYLPGFANGMYVFKLVTPTQTYQQKMILVR